MLSDTTGRRITGLREREDMTLDKLAAKIGINATTLGRIEKGQTQKINSDVLVALAREFSVSTDFLLGLTSIPERKNYDVSELGLSAQSVRNLYTQRVDTDVVNRYDCTISERYLCRWSSCAEPNLCVYERIAGGCRATRGGTSCQFVQSPTSSSRTNKNPDCVYEYAERNET